MFTFAAAALLLAPGRLGHEPGRRLVVTALVAALVAFAVDVYLY